MAAVQGQRQLPQQPSTEEEGGVGSYDDAPQHLHSSNAAEQVVGSTPAVPPTQAQTQEPTSTQQSCQYTNSAESDNSLPMQGVTSIAPLPPPPPTTTTTSTPEGAGTVLSSTPCEADVVDSALQAALREPRERAGLLRLEQTLIHFVQQTDPNAWLDVGGPYNSVWKLGPTSTSHLGGNSILNSSSSTMIMVGGPRQTSFQRCLLHRLADRFGISREIGTSFEGAIRLIKHHTFTQIPSRLLQDLLPHEYNYNNTNNTPSTILPSSSSSSWCNNDANSAVSGSAVATDAIGISADVVTQGVTVALSQATLDTNILSGNAPMAVPSTPPQPKKPSVSSSSSSNRKMKILLKKSSDRSRSTTPIHSNTHTSAINSNTTSTTDPASSSVTLLKKSSSSVLSDKEKAYAEARARIFNDEPTFTTPAADDVTSSTSSSSASNPHQGNGEDLKDPNLQLQPSQSVSAASQPVPPPPATAAAAVASTGANSVVSIQSTGSGGSSVRDSNSFTDQKAVYRNRLEEASDPDFQRGVVVMYPTPVVNNAAYQYAPGAISPYAATASVGNAATQLPQHQVSPLPTVHSYNSIPVPTTTAAAAARDHPYSPSYHAVHATARPYFAGNTTTIPSNAAAAARPGALTSQALTSRRPSSGSGLKLAADAPAFYPSWASTSSSSSTASGQATPSATTVTLSVPSSKNPPLQQP